MKRVSEAVTKRLFAVSGNICAFPKCPLPLTDAQSGKVTGRICHVKARNPSGPRYDASQTDEERHAFENLILMCPIHHDVIDADETSYTVERLLQIKADHEKKWNRSGSDLSDDLTRALISLSDVQVQQGAVLVAVNQGQIAQSITNIQQASPQRIVMLEPVVRRVPNEPHRQFTTLQIRLRSVGNAKPADARVTFRFPESMHSHNRQDGLKYIRNGWVECERDNRYFQEAGAFEQLYPGDTMQYAIFGIITISSRSAL